MRKLNLSGTSAGRNLIAYAILTTFSIFISGHRIYAQCETDPGTIQGIVFEDSNFNGVQDEGEVGISNVLVNAFSATGGLEDQSMTDFFGNYSLSGLSDEASYRLEFVYGSNYSPSLTGVNNETDIQFSNAPSCAQNLALVNPDKACTEDAQIALTCFVRSTESNSNDAVETLVYTDYNFNTESSVGKFADKQATGSVWGLTWKSSTRTLYSSAFVKQYAALTSHGHDAIFSTDVNTGVTTLHAKLSELGVPTGNVVGDHNNIAYGAQTGKLGLGGLEISDDEQSLYVINIYNNTLVKLSSSDATQATTSSYAIPDPSCFNGDTYRAFAITKSAGKIYVGVTCTSEESGASGELSATVFEFDPNDESFTNIFSTDFPKGYWTDSPANSLATQAWLTDLAFTDEGNMVISLSDRVAHRFADEVTNGRLDDQHPDILLAYNDNGTWKLESGGFAGDLEGSHTDSAEGPDGGEFFGFDYWISGPVYHSEIATGSVATLPGTGTVIATVFDPDFDSYTGGLHRYSTSNGSKLGAAIVYEHSNDPQFGKASGLGDLVPMCGYIPLEIGNLLWVDANENGTQDAGEAALGNIELSLFDDNCNRVGNTTTDGNGNYYFNASNVDLNGDGSFDGLALGSNYYVVITDAAFSAATGTLTTDEALVLTNANVGFGTNSDRNDSDAYVLSGICDDLVGLPYVAVSTGGSGSSDHSFDIGFAPAKDFDLALKKEIASGQNVRYGEVVKFDITVYNQGGVTSNSVAINDYISDGYTFEEDLNEGWIVNNNIARTLLGNPLTPGAQQTVSISLIVKEGASASELINYAEIDGAYDAAGEELEDIDSSPDNLSDNDNGGVAFSETDNEIFDSGDLDEDDHDPAGVRIFDLALRKELADPTAQHTVNSPIDFKITIFNQGSIPATSVEVTDYLPVGLSFVAADNDGWSTSEDGNLVYAVSDVIAPLTSRVIDLTLTLNDEAGDGVIVNYAEISSASDEDGLASDVDSEADNIDNNDNGGNPDDATDNEVNDHGDIDEDDHDPASIRTTIFDLALFKTTDAHSVKSGMTVDFDITIVNQGDISADNIEIVDYIPGGLTLNDSDWEPYGDNMAKHMVSSSTGELPAGGLQPDNEVTIQVSMDVSEDFTAGSLVNFAEISYVENEIGVDFTFNDFDSSPDDQNNNDVGGLPLGPTDNEIMDNGINDEDDHDPAILFVFASLASEECICLNNVTDEMPGQFGEIIEIEAASGQTWYVHQAQGIYDAGLAPGSSEPTGADFPQFMQYPLTTFATGPTGYNLVEFPIGDGNSKYFLTGVILDMETYEIVLRSSVGDQTILNGGSCSYEQTSFEAAPGVCAGSLVTYCVEDFNSGGSNNWSVTGDAFIDGADFEQCVDVQFGATIGDEVVISFQDLDAIGCYSPARATVTIGESSGSLSCLSSVNVSLNQFCDLGLTPEALLTSEITVGSVYVNIYQDAQGNMLPDDIDWSDHVGEQIIVKVMDACSGNSCWSFVNIEDKRAPEIECFDITVSCIEMRDYVGPFTLDNCSGEGELLQTGEVIEAQDCDMNYVSIITRTYKASDAYGNMSDECTQLISVSRPELDDIVAPPNYTVENMNPLSCAGYELNEEGEIDPLVYGVPTLEGVPLYPQADQFCNLGVAYQDLVLPTNDCVQKIMRTWTIFEWWCTFGEMDTIVQVFNIADMENPTITCPSDMTVSSNGTDCEGDIVLAPAEVMDDCTQDPVVDITYPGGFLDNMNGGAISLPIGTHEVTYTVYDDCFNSTDCSLMITVQDDAAPIAVCHQNTVLGLRSDGATYAYASAFDDGSYDDCNFDRLAVKRMDDGAACDTLQDEFSELVDFCCSDVGDTVIVILRVYDVQGNYNDCMVNVQIQDKNPPTIVAPDDMTVSCLTEFEFADLSLQFGSAEAFDNCMNPTITETHVSTISVCRTGTITRTFVASDGNGTATAQQTITVVNENPFDGMDIEWPEDYVTSAQCDPGSLSPDNLPAPFDRPTFTEDFCDQVAISHTDLVYNIIGSGGACQKIVRSWIIEDFCQPLGNNTYEKWEYDQTLTISNEVAPTFTSNNDDVTVCSMNENCATGMITLSAGVEDDCTPGDMLGWSYIVEFGVDGMENLSDMGTGDTVTVTGDYPLGTHTITFTFEDLCGNPVSTTQEFTIESCVGPKAACLELAVGLEAMDTDGDNIVDDEMAVVCARMFNASSYHPCDLDITYSFSEDPADSCRTFSCSDFGLNDVSIYVIDETGRFDFCVTTLDVQDNNTVDICNNVDDCVTMPMDITVTPCVNDLLPETINSMPIVDPDCICTQFTLDYTDTDLSDASNTCTIIQRDWVVTFTCGFTKEFLTSQIITKFNDSAPILECPDNVTVASLATECNGPVVVGVPVVLSDCSTGIVITNDSEFADSNTGAATGSYPVGTTTVTYTVTDACNNVATCEVLVTVTDDADPICVAQDITIAVVDELVDVTISAEQIDNNSSDECGTIVDRTVSPNSFGCDDVGRGTQVTLTVFDDSGNSSSCAARVEVQDSVAPICIAKDVSTDIVVVGTFNLPTFLLDDGSFDPCGGDVSFSSDPSMFGCEDVGMVDVTLTVTDENGNTAECTSVVTIRDAESPTCIAQDVTVQLDGNDQVTVSADQVDNGSFDGCTGIDTLFVTPSMFTCADLGPNDVTLNVQDSASNVSTCTAVVTVEANPNLVCIAQDVTVFLDASGAAAVSADSIDNGSGIPCAADVSVSIDRSEFFCNDVGIEREVILTVSDGGQSITCSAMVMVLDTIPPVLACPDPVTVNCMDLNADLSVYGDVSTSASNCSVLPEDIAVTVDSDLNDCGVGVITRNFLAVDVNGNSATCSQVITVANPDPFTEDDITWTVDTFRITQCISTDPDTIDSRPIIDVSAESCSNVSVDYDDINLTNSMDCRDTISRTWTVIDSCQLVEGTTAGIFTFEQIITIQDEMAPIIVAVDTIRQCVSEVEYIFDVDDCNDVTVTNDSGMSTGTDISGTYPDGETKVQISATDRCGNTSTDSVVIVIELDTIAPVVNCISRVIVIEEDGVTEVTAADGGWFFSVSDNKTDSADLTYAFNLDFEPDTLRFICDSVSIKSHVVCIYVRDEAGNIDSCKASYVTRDPNGVCTGGLATIQGQVMTESKLLVPEVQISLVNGDMYEMTDVDGIYGFPAMEGEGAYELKPEKNTGLMDGVSTLDLVLIQRHILGLQKLGTVYQHIAADINKSGAISGKDLIDLKKNILGISDQFPGNTSWRFVDEDYSFIDVNNPLNEQFRESFIINDLNGPVYKNFVGVKIGDVNGSIEMKSSSNASSRQNALALDVSDEVLTADTEYSIPLFAKENIILAGYQISFVLDAEIDLISIESDLVEVNASDYSIIEIDGKKVVLISVIPSESQEILVDEELFRIDIAPSTKVQLSKAVRLNDEFRNEIYDSELLVRELEVNYSDLKSVNGEDVLYQNSPNPWNDKTMISFNLSKDQSVILNVYDVTGKLVDQKQGSFSAGMNEVEFSNARFKESGVYYYELVTDSDRISKRMILIK